MNNNINKLPNDFSAKVMAELGRRIEKRKQKKKIYITVCIIVSVVAVLLTGMFAVFTFYPQIGMEIKSYYTEFINSINAYNSNIVPMVSFKESIDNALAFISNNVMAIICLMDFGILYLVSNVLSKRLHSSRV